MEKKKNIFIGFLFVVLLAGAVGLGMNWDNWFGSEKNPVSDIDDNADDWTGNKETYTGKKNTNTIDIPGFGAIDFKANVAEQAVNLYNPEQNTCYFKMTLLLPDGRKLWESKMISPGKAIYSITLNQALKSGTYKDATLKYECFTIDEARTPLNGSEIKLTLNVRE